MKIKIPRVDKAKKKAITMEECRKFFSIVSEKKSYQRVMDICKMVLCLAGINVADLYNMKRRTTLMESFIMSARKPEVGEKIMPI